MCSFVPGENGSFMFKIVPSAPKRRTNLPTENFFFFFKFFGGPSLLRFRIDGLISGLEHEYKVKFKKFTSFFFTLRTDYSLSVIAMLLYSDILRNVI